MSSETNAIGSPKATLHILHVEDNNSEAIYIRELLKKSSRYNFILEHTQSLNKTIELLTQHQYNAILLDLFLPDSQSLETLANIQKACPEIPIIVLTGTENDDVVSNTIKLGAQDCLVKTQLSSGLLSHAIQFAIDRKKMDKALKKSEERLKLIISGASVGIWDWNIETDEMYYSDRFLELIGYNQQKFPQHFSSWEEILHPEDHHQTIAHINKHLKHKIPYNVEYRLKNRSGEYRWYQSTGQATWDKNDKPIHMAGSISDITVRKANETALRESEERLQLSLKAGKIGIWDWYPYEHKLTWHPNMHMLYGTDPKEFLPIPKNIIQRIHPDDRDHLNQSMENALHHEKYHDVEYRVIHPDNSIHYITSKGKVILNEEGKAYRFAGTCIDITTQKIAEEELKKSEERFQCAISGTDDGIWDWPNVSRDEEYWSPQFKKLLGYDENEIEASFSKFKSLLHPDDIERVSKAIEEHLENDITFNIEYRLQKKNSEYNWFRAKGKATRDKNGHPIRMSGSISDINQFKIAQNEKMAMEEQLRQAQKLESIGQLAAGIAHEINTPIQFVGDNANFLKDSFNDIIKLINKYKSLLVTHKNQEPTEACIEEIENCINEIDLEYLNEEIPIAIDQSIEGVDRVSSIVKAMKDFSHPGSNNKELTDINQAIENTITVSRNEWKYIANIEKKFDEQLPMVECLPGEFNQTILNIIVNAAHAIKDTLNEEKEKGSITISTHTLDNEIEITVEDDGAGIPDEIQKKIFDPFFTTKEVGKGTGQGLSLAYSVIVDKHQGGLSVESTPNVGTIFHIKLPTRSNYDNNEIEENEKTPIAC